MTKQNGKTAPAESCSPVPHELCNEIYFIFPLNGDGVREHMSIFFRTRRQTSVIVINVGEMIL